jgi:insecticidal toxin complex protein TccC
MAGRLVAQFDPRLSGPSTTHLYDLNGQPLKVSNVDAGWRLSLPGLAGQTVQRWDARGVHWRSRYDELLRLVAISNSADTLSGTFTYADASAPPEHNQRGRLLEQIDPSGSLHLTATAWPVSHCAKAAPLPMPGNLSPSVFSARWTRCWNRPTLAAIVSNCATTSPANSNSYNCCWPATTPGKRCCSTRSSTPSDRSSNNRPAMACQPLLGLRARHWASATAMGAKGAQPPLQDISYEYDPVGNPTRILDNVFTPSHFANQRVDGERAFHYDSLYRLISASGYDDATPGDIPGRPQPSDPNDRRNYLQTYRYDHGGNLTQLRHVREGACQTRLMHIDAASNRGVRWKEGDPAPDFEQLFDRHGNLMALQPGQTLRWDARDQLASVTLVQRENGPDDAEFYHYSQGARLQTP